MAARRAARAGGGVRAPRPAPGRTLIIRPATPSRWGDVAALFGASGACDGCWCQFWKLRHAEYKAGANLEQMIEEDLVAERIAIESYGEMIAFLENKDPTTRRMLEGILAVEEQHAEELASMREDVRKLSGGTSRRGGSAA